VCHQGSKIWAHRVHCHHCHHCHLGCFRDRESTATAGNVGKRLKQEVLDKLGNVFTPHLVLRQVIRVFIDDSRLTNGIWRSRRRLLTSTIPISVRPQLLTISTFRAPSLLSLNFSEMSSSKLRHWLSPWGSMTLNRPVLSEEDCPQAQHRRSAKAWSIIQLP